MVEEILVSLLVAAGASMVILLVAVWRLDRERRALLDRLLVANQIMPLTKDPPPAQKIEMIPQKIKFKLFP